MNRTLTIALVAAAVLLAAGGPALAGQGRFKTVTRTFSHGGVVGIDVLGPSKNYPAPIAVAGLKAGTIKDIDVRIPAFFHDFPDDVDILLVGPRDQRAVVLSDIGGGTATTIQRDLLLDDEAAQPLPDQDPLVDGTFRPTNAVGNDTNGVDVFPDPAPAAGGTAGSALSAFDGTNPNGEWQLFVVDDGAGDGGLLLAPGWSLTITARVRR